MIFHSDMTKYEDERQGLPSASNWRRYELCPGSFQLEAEARKLNQAAQVSGAAAERGERIHAWLAGIPDEDGNEIVLNDSELQTGEFLVERMSEQRSRVFGEEATLQLSEKRLWLTLNGKRILSGRFDRVVYTPTVALLQDAKTGWAEPDPAEQNAQLKVLAVLVALHLPSVKEVIVQIVSGPYGITEGRYDRPALKEAWDSIVATWRALQAPDAPLKPSPEACHYCPALSICQAVKNLVLPVATKTQISALPDGARGARLLDEIEVIEDHLESIRAYYAKRLSEDPAFDLPGWALVPNAPRREIEDVEAAKSRLAEFLDNGELNAAMDLKVGQVEKIFGKKVGLKGKELREKFNAVMQGVIVEKTPSPSLRRISGKPKLVEVTLP
jgi:hypothetical protein